MNHFLDIETLTPSCITSLFERALAFKMGASPLKFPEYRMVNLFYENSTRTRMSFELAASHLNVPFFSFHEITSSAQKGETVLDTVQTLSAMGMNLFVVRHQEAGLPKRLSEMLKRQGHVINAGDGMHAHPTQAMLDWMTIAEHYSDIQTLKIAMIGDILHSRVARSLQSLFFKMGVQTLRLIAPKEFSPCHMGFGTLTDSLEEGLSDVDVIICLRVQFERFSNTENFDKADYIAGYQLTPKALSYAKPTAIVMHPGPVNRGIEIDGEVVDGPQAFILKQVQNGVYMRMAIMEALLC